MYDSYTLKLAPEVAPNHFRYSHACQNVITGELRVYKINIEIYIMGIVDMKETHVENTKTVHKFDAHSFISKEAKDNFVQFWF